MCFADNFHSNFVPFPNSYSMMQDNNEQPSFRSCDQHAMLCESCTRRQLALLKREFNAQSVQLKNARTHAYEMEQLFYKQVIIARDALTQRDKENDTAIEKLLKEVEKWKKGLEDGKKELEDGKTSH